MAPIPAPARLAVLISGSGSNLAALLEAAAEPDYGAQVVCVGADRASAAGLEHARCAGIPTFVHRVDDYASRAEWDAAVAEATQQYAPDLVVSAGFLKLLGPEFLARFGGRLVNTHNSLLPAFPGMRGPAAALEHGVKITGATLFLCDAGADTGQIVAQTAVPVHDDDTVESLTERIKVAERSQLVTYVGKMVREGWSVHGRTVRIP